MSVIEDVVVKDLKLIPDERGFLMECVRSDDPLYGEFGQAYISAVYKDCVKGWHKHREQTDFVVCVKGMIKLVVFDTRVGSSSEGEFMETFLGEQKPRLVKIPKGLYHGWMGLTDGLSLVLNCPDKTYNYEDPDEDRLPAHRHLPYEWGRKDG